MRKKLWYAVDEDGERWIYGNEPFKGEVSWGTKGECFLLNANIILTLGLNLPKITFNDGPVEIEINIK